MRVLIVFLILNISCAKPVPQKSCNFLMNSSGQRISWHHALPIVYYVHNDFPKQYIVNLDRAIKLWEDTTGRNLFQFNGYVHGTPYQDGLSIIYWLNEWEPEKPNEQARTTVYWTGDQIYEFDMRVNNKNFKWIDGHKYDSVDIESVLIHELGHALGLAHHGDIRSVMFPQLPNDYVRTTLTEDNINSINCVYGN